MKQERETFFFFNPSRTLSTAIVALLFSVLWLAIEIKHGNPGMAALFAGIIAVSLFMIFHSTKWVFRMWREYLS